MNYQVMAFDETTLTDFHDVILPDVLAELYGLDDFSDYGILAVGAMQEGQAIGALIARVLSEADVQILSICVVPGCRRAGVGRTMLDGLAALSFDLFDSAEKTGVPVGICIDYVADDEHPGGLEPFLDKNGFRYREERPALYRFTAGCADALSGSGESHHLPDDARDIFSAWLDGAEMNGEPELCVYTGEADDPQCLLLLTDAGDGSYDLLSAAQGECSDAAFEAALKLLLQTPERSAEIYADGAKNVCPAVLAKAAGCGGRIFRHRYAQRRLMIEKGEPV